MDALNRAIVTLLEQDGRLAFKEIAAQLKVSEGTVRNRVGERPDHLVELNDRARPTVRHDHR